MQILRSWSAIGSVAPWRSLIVSVLFTHVAILFSQGARAEDVPTIRVATYNASLYGKASDEVRQRLSDGKDDRAAKIAAVVQVVRPDILLVNEIDFDPQSTVAKLLAEKFFAVSQGGRNPILYPHVRAFASNTGVDSGLDLNRNGQAGEPNDAWGYGVYPGQYSMAVFSRFPLVESEIRTFQHYRWADLPGALRPIDPKTETPYYDEATWSALRLSSKNHIDVPIRLPGFTLHVLASHPTPPVFDGGEDRNGCRNHDEVRFWIDYLSGTAAQHLVDDRDRAGGLDAKAFCVVMGDLNADPLDGDGKREAISKLLSLPRLQDPRPQSVGAAEAATNGTSRRKRTGDPALHTASFGRNGNLRLDYVIPSRSLTLVGGGVHWPATSEAGRTSIDATDHRLVWIDVTVPTSSRP